MMGGTNSLALKLPNITHGSHFSTGSKDINRIANVTAGSHMQALGY
jgi:hypothetical protein